MISDFGAPIQTLLVVQSVWLAVTIFNQIVSWRFDWLLPHQANNRFRSWGEGFVDRYIDGPF